MENQKTAGARFADNGRPLVNPGRSQFPLASRHKKLLDDLDVAMGGTFPVSTDAYRPLRVFPRVLPDVHLDIIPGWQICTVFIG